MNVIIVEDEPKQLELLTGMLKSNFPELRIVAEVDSVLSAASAIKQYQPDLVFLDVVIKGGTSFDLLEQLSQLDAAIIFITSFEQFAIQAFRLSAVDYLMKPIDADELREAIAKAKKTIQAEDSAEHLKLLMANYRSENGEEMKIALPTYKGYSFIKPEEIVRCESDNTYTTFFLIDKREILVSKTLKSCELMLSNFSFCRVHNSSLINLKYIEAYERGEGGVVKMTDGSEVPISRRRKDNFLRLFKSQTN